MRLLPSVLVNFKEVYTSNICKLNINPNWTTRQFLDNIWPHISRYFNTHNFMSTFRGLDLANILNL